MIVSKDITIKVTFQGYYHVIYIPRSKVTFYLLWSPVTKQGQNVLWDPAPVYLHEIQYYHYYIDIS